jgi:hypothetical protein
MEGPVDLDALMQKRPPSASEMVITPPPPHVVLNHNAPQMFLVATSARLKEESQRVTLRNTDRHQTHIMIDRFLIGHELQPGQQKEIEMTVDEIAAHREKLRPNRGVYMSGHLAGRPLPTHPVIFVDIAPPTSMRVEDGGGGDNVVPTVKVEVPPEPPPAPEPAPSRRR